jgi:hypothetical protein
VGGLGGLGVLMRVGVDAGGGGRQWLDSPNSWPRGAAFVRLAFGLSSYRVIFARSSAASLVHAIRSSAVRQGRRPGSCRRRNARAALN